MKARFVTSLGFKLAALLVGVTGAAFVGAVCLRANAAFYWGALTVLLLWSIALLWGLRRWVTFRVRALNQALKRTTTLDEALPNAEADDEIGQLQQRLEALTLRWQNAERLVAEGQARLETAEAHSQSLARMNRVLSDLHLAMVKAQDISLVFQAATRSLVEKGGFALSWVGLVDPKTGQVKVAAQASLAEADRSQAPTQLSEDCARGSCLLAAVRTNRNVVANDLAKAPWNRPGKAAPPTSCRAMAAIPLLINGEARGALQLGSAHPGYFDAAELALLDGLANELAFAVDVVEREERRRLAEEARREGEERFATFMDQLPAAAFVKDQAGRVIFCNRFLADLFGWHQWEGKTTADLLPPMLAERMMADDRQVLSEGPIVVTETFPGPTETLTFQTSKFALRREGKPPLLGGISVEITERKRAEEALRESERKYRELVENANSIILRWDPEGRVTFLNEYGQTFFGFTEAELLGRNVMGTIVPETESTGRDLRPLIDQIKADPAAFESNVNENMRRDGSRVWVAWTNRAVFNADGSIIEVFSVGTDITERKHAEEDRARLEAQLRQSQRLESIGRLAAGVAHDFNNLLTVIRGNASLLATEPALGQEPKTLLREITEASERAANLTRQLLLFSRKQKMQVQPVDLNDLTRHLTGMLRRMLREDIALQVSYAPEVPPVVADPGMIEQVILNLVVNARDAMPDGGELRITTGVQFQTTPPAAVESHTQPGTYVTLTVADTGFGIPPELRERVFEPFFTTKEEGKGTGLGLATVYGIVRQHQGWVDLESIVGHGTTFRVHLPASGPSPLESHPTRTERCPVGHGERILVVEDDQAVRELVRRILTSNGYEVTLANSGAQAYKLPEEKWSAVDLLLTDIVMPGGLSGRELAERVWRKRPGLKVIFLSGYSPDALAHRESLPETALFLSKPCSPETLLEAVATCLSRKITATPEGLR